MSGWLKKVRDKVSPDKADKAADAIEDNATDERVDSVLGRVPGGQSVADKVPDNVGEKAGDAVRDNLGSSKSDTQG